MDNNKITKKTLPAILTIAKYLFSIILTILAYTRVDKERFLVACLLELFIIFTLSNILMFKKALGRTVNCILMLLYNIQVAVLFFGNSYVTMLMLTNIDSLKALSGKAAIYISGVLLVLIFTFLPIKRITSGKNTSPYFLSLSLALALGFTMIFGNSYSPYYGYLDIYFQYRESIEITKAINEAANNDTSNITDFYKEGVENHVSKNAGLTKQPNVILIFTEGLSQNIIDDPRGIMPNVAEYQQKSFAFTNYFNHTFATYRGLVGQLYSGYQLEDFDSNPLISLQSIFSDEGYNTFFINSEPHNSDFSAYLENLKFDTLLGTTDDECNGMADSISDKQVYEMIYDLAIEQEESDEPFLISTYTFGTHASLDSTDQKFGDGSEAELNKFYDVDYQFGQFMDKFMESPLAENTIVIFTADHATYQDDSFNISFPDYSRAATSIDEIPLFIYYKDIEPGTLDVGGRNSICLAPTILDYLDISAPNYFVGTSLYSNSEPPVWETSYSDFYVTYSSKGGVIGSLEEPLLSQFKQFVQDYYITKELKSKELQ